MKKQTIAVLVIISVLLGSAVHVMPVSAIPTAQASGGFAERTGSYDFDMLRLIRA